MPAKLYHIKDGDIEFLEVDISTCRGAEFMDALEKVKNISGRWFHQELITNEDGTTRTKKVWRLPNEPATAEKALYALEPTAAPELVEWVKAGRIQTEEALVTPLPDDADLLIPWAKQRCDWQPEFVNGEPFTGLKQHQRPAVDLMAREKRAILADDMGLGKTIQIIATVEEVKLREGLDNGPKLVVCPNSVKGVWQREIHRWLGEDEPVVVVDGATPAKRAKQIEDGIAENAWIVANYEQLRITPQRVPNRAGGHKTVKVMKEPLFEDTEWLAVIADEVHRIKNKDAKQTQGVWRCQGYIQIGATGTPVMNSPDELWSILRWLWPDEYHERGKNYKATARAYWTFYEQYVEYTEGYFGKVITGVKNPDALRYELSGRLIRRTKHQVLDLPEKQRIIVPVLLGTKQRKLYEETENALWLDVEKAMEEGDTTAKALVEAAEAGQSLYLIQNGAARTVRLRQVLSSPALLGGDDISAKYDAIVEAILDNSHKPHVVFDEFVEGCEILAERLRKQNVEVATYTGEVKPDERRRLEDLFQAGKLDAIIGTIGAMREGITLTAADTQHWAQRAWVPGWNEQGEDRCHRIGQRNAVTILIYEAERTVDDGKIAPTNRLKERIVKTILPKDHIQEVKQK